MDKEEKKAKQGADEGQAPDDQQGKAEEEKTPAEIMREMKAEFDTKLAAKETEIAALKAKHAAEVRDILTGRDEAANKQVELADRVKAAAQKIQKNLGVI